MLNRIPVDTPVLSQVHCRNFIQNHLRESMTMYVSCLGQAWHIRHSLCLNSLSRLSHRLCDIVNPDDRVWFNDPEQILFEKGIIQRSKM